MTGKTVIVTGASDGIGKALARQLKERGASVIITGRSPEKTKAVGEELGIPYYIADFADLSQVRALGYKLLSACPRIDYLYNNAGGMFGGRTLTADGYEKTFQVDYLAHFLLTGILFETLAGSKAVIVNTSSVANSALSRFDITDLNMEKRHTSLSAYGNAKLETILFTKEFNRRYGRLGISMVSYYPGNVMTNFSSGEKCLVNTLFAIAKRFRFLGNLFLISPEKACDTALWFADSTPGIDWQPGGYYYKRRPAKPHRLADDPSVASSLWRQSESMTSFRYPTFR